jgi:hypothetical protein
LRTFSNADTNTTNKVVRQVLRAYSCAENTTEDYATIWYAHRNIAILAFYRA